ncbi:MAG: hypothetical protein LBQ47_02470 [Endomicrobium sp.]|nr:hypothetical protein [Endomicrobium sp.]
MLIVKIENLTFAIPFRSNIRHKYAYMTDKVNACGIDYSKAVVILNPNHIDTLRKPIIRPQEHRALRGKEYVICKDFSKYLKDYKEAFKNNFQRAGYLYRFSALQYFHKELGLTYNDK